VLPLPAVTADWVALGAAAGAFLALVAGLSAHVRVSRLRRGFAALDGVDGPHSVLDALTAQQREAKGMRAELAATRTEVAATRSELADSLRHVSVVRYDAFGDMGGRLSFTAALLDDSGDGLVITSIHGRSEARTYAKGVKAGRSEQSLSPEEEQSIELAMRGPGRR
jgi:hypothetical protein